MLSVVVAMFTTAGWVFSKTLMLIFSSAEMTAALRPKLFEAELKSKE
jgi:hypothetical protein